MERVYLPAADDDSSLGYTAQDVLEVVNRSAVASLTWYDGATTKLRFGVQLSDVGQWGGVAIFDPPPGDCYRAMRIGVQATLATDDGRLHATLYGFVATQDEGGLFDINHTTIAIVEDQLGGATGPLASAVPALIGVPPTDCEYAFRLVPKGVTCSSACDPGVSGCPLLGGTLAVTGNDYSTKQCVSANVAFWTWD